MLELPLNVAQQLSSDAPLSSGIAKNSETPSENPFLNILAQQGSSDDGNLIAAEEDSGQLFAGEGGEILPDNEGFFIPVAANLMEDLELEVSLEDQIAKLTIETNLDDDEPNLELTEQELSILAKQILSNPEQSSLKEANKAEDIDLAALAQELDQDGTSGSDYNDNMSHQEGEAENLFQSEKMRNSNDIIRTAQVNFKEIKNTTQGDQTKIKTAVINDNVEVTQVEVNDSSEELVADIEADVRPKNFSTFKDELEVASNEEISGEEEAANVISASKAKATGDLLAASQTANSLTSNAVSQVDSQSLQHKIVNDEVTNYEVSAKVGEEAWEPELASKLVMMKTNGVNSAKLQLNPPELGPLDVSLDMASDKLNIVFSSNQAITRDAIDAAIPKLQQMFSKNEVDVVNVSVTSQNTPDKGDHQGNQNSGKMRKLGSIGKINQMHNANQQVVVNVPRSVSHAGVVDYYA